MHSPYRKCGIKIILVNIYLIVLYFESVLAGFVPEESLKSATGEVKYLTQGVNV